jgi:excisionase family DNA binding protein
VANEDLLSVEQAAAEFGVHRTTLFRAISAGRLPRHRWMGDRRTFVKRSDVQALVDSPATTRCLSLIYKAFVESGEWPKLSDLQRGLARQNDDLDLYATLDALPRELGWRNQDQEGRAELTLMGIARCENSGEDVAAFVTVVRLAYDIYMGESESLEVTSGDLAEQFGFDPLTLMRLQAIVRGEPYFWTQLGGSPDGAWVIRFDDRVRHFRGVGSLSDYFQAKQRMIGAASLLRAPAAIGRAPAPTPLASLEPIMAEAIQLLQQGNGTAAVVAAASAYERLLADKLQTDELFGRRLITVFFDRAARAQPAKARETEALAAIALGAFSLFRNQAAHGRRRLGSEPAIEVVTLFSLLARESDALAVTPLG